MFCEVTVDGEKKLVWINVKNMKFEENELKYQYGSDKSEVRNIDKPLGIVRRVILTYRLDGDKMVVTPVVQVIVGEWADESVDLDRIRDELERCGVVKEIELGREKMLLTIPTKEEHIENLLKDIGDPKKIDYKIVRALAELCTGDVRELKETETGGKLREKIFDFIKPSDDSMVVRFLDLYSKAAERVNEKNGKLMNGVGIYSIIGEYEYGNEKSGTIDLVFVDPYWHNYKSTYMISPEIVRYAENPAKLGEILTARENLRNYLSHCTREYRKNHMVWGARYFFYVRVFQLEYIAKICEVDIKEFKFKFDIGEVSIEDLINLRKEIANHKKGGWWSYLKENSWARKIFLEVCGFKNLEEVSKKKIGFENVSPKPLIEILIKNLAGEPRATTLIRTLGLSYSSNLALLLYLIDTKQTFADFMKEVEKEMTGKEPSKQKISTLSRFLSNYDPAKALLEKEWKEIEEKIKDLPEKSLVRMRLENLRERIDEHTARLGWVIEDIERTVSSLKSPSSYLSGILQYWLAELMFLFGVSIGLTLIKEKFDHVAWLIKNQNARLGLGVALTAIFIVGINVEGDWINTILNPKKQLMEALKNEIVERSTSLGSKIKDAVKPDPSFTMGMIIGGLATVLKGLDIPFYTTDELCDRLCDWIKTINRGAGETLQKILSFEIPLINQKIFDLIIGFALGGPAELIGDVVIGTVLQQAIMPIINNAIMDITINILTSTI